MTCKTRFRVASVSFSLPLRTLEAVPMLTPAVRATSRIVTVFVTQDLVV
jgi:hypothetical protein